MRQVIKQQKSIGQIDIADIEIDTLSRDDVPAILKGLQFIYTHDEIRKQIFDLLESSLDPEIKTDVGRPGMDLWTIFVLGSLKLGLNCDYDRLQELANQHITLRQMLGHSDFVLSKDSHYGLQTIIDNVSFLTPKLLDEINQVVVKAGHSLLLGEDDCTELKGRCDSFVAKTDVHYPTDANLLWDAMRVLIIDIGRFCGEQGISGWRQYRNILRKLKKLFRLTQKVKASTSKDEAKKQKRQEEIHQLYRDYLSTAERLLVDIMMTKEKISSVEHMDFILRLQEFIAHARRQIDQIRRRVLNGEVIGHEEKVFSIFEEHTEWVSKGKAGVPVELGVRVCILEDQHQFILHHRIMWKETDDKVAVMMVSDAQERFPQLKHCSFDAGFYSPKNREELTGLLDKTVMPKKGRLSEKEKEIVNSEDYMTARYQHSAIESCINNLGVRGLDRCYLYGKDGFERHVALAIVSANVHRIGMILQRQEREELRNVKKVKKKRLLAA